MPQARNQREIPDHLLRSSVLPYLSTTIISSLILRRLTLWAFGVISMVVMKQNAVILTSMYLFDFQSQRANVLLGLVGCVRYLIVL